VQENGGKERRRGQPGEGLLDLALAFAGAGQAFLGGQQPLQERPVEVPLGTRLGAKVLQGRQAVLETAGAAPAAQHGIQLSLINYIPFHKLLQSLHRR